MHVFLRGSVGLAALLLTLSVCSARDEEKIPLDKLPQAVAEAVKAKFAGAQLVEASKEVVDGKTLFEVALKHEGSNYDVTYMEDGKLVSVEKEITVKELPQEVAKALEKDYAKAEIKKVEDITADDKKTYEVLLKTADGQLLELVFDPQGKILKTEKKTDKDKA